MQPFEIGRLTRLDLGYVGETGSREIQIDMSEWLERWPDGKIAVDVLKPGRKEYYLADTTVEDGILTWTVTYADVAKAGRGMVQISIYDFESGTVYKSRCVETIIRESADMAEDLEAPHPMETWVARAVEAKEGALEAAVAAAQSASVAKAAETVVVEARDRAEAAAAAAENSETIAANASANATEKAAEASASAAAAERYASDAEAANDEVQGKASEVRDNADRAEAAAEGLETAVTEAVKAKNTATEQAQIAKTAAQNASAAVNNATTAAKAAADYAVAAQNASDAAENAAGAAENAAGAAENAAGAALNAMGGAGNAMTQAQESAEAAAESERNAKESMESAKAVLGSIPDDYTKIAEIVNTKAPGILQKRSGSIASITDGGAMPANTLISQIKAVQSGEGDPAPDNVRPIRSLSGVNVNRKGKNLFDLNAVESWPISNDNTSDKRYGVKSMYRAGEYTISCKVNPGGTYIYVKKVKADGSLGDPMYFVQPSVATKYTIDLAENEGLLVYNAAGGATKESTINIFAAAKIQIEKGDTETGYEPYQQGVTLTAQFPQNVYGGSFNWNTGVLTVTHRANALRAADIGYKSTSVSVNTSCFVTKPDASLATGNLTSMCSHFKNTWGDAYQATSARHGIFSDHEMQTTKYFNWGEPDATVTDFGNWLEEQYAAGTPVTVVCLLKEPYTIQLTPQQLDLMKGYNYIWSDTGDMDLEYTADTKIYIDNAIAAIAASIINV